MQTILPRLLIPLFLLLAGRLGAEPLEVSLSSRFLVRGEQAMLEYVLPRGVNPSANIFVPEVQNLSIRQVGFGPEPRRGFGRRLEYVFTFAVTSYTPGDYIIPAASLDTGNGVISSEPVSLRVFHETDLEWRSVRAGSATFRYAAAFHITDASPFVNEVIPVELKVYVPARQRIEDWGIPEFERDGIAAWRFEPRPTIGRANLPGGAHYAISYPSTLSPTRAGEVSLGPAKLRLMTIQSSVEQFGSAFYEPAFLEIPAINLEARKLPAAAPEGFKDAVGSFEVTVSTPETEVREGDPVTVNLTVSGSGNLDTLDPPAPLEADGWQLYPPTSVQRSDRRSISGEAGFRLFMRPLRQQSQVPPFRFVYFDPEEEAYRTIISDPIPLTVLPSTSAPALGAAVPPALPMPVEQMNDILGIIASPDRISRHFDLPLKWWQLVPAAVVVILLGQILRRHLAPRLRTDPSLKARKRELRELSKSTRDARAFYRQAGAFVERWLGHDSDPLPAEVLARRDEICFRKDMSTSPVKRAECQRILRRLRRLALPLVAFAAILAVSPELRAEEEKAADTDPATAYGEARFADAAELWLESAPWDRMSADTLYNIGNAAYRLGAPGEAALYWRRALERDDTHPEARQNLRFLERKFGSITIKRPDYQYTIAKVPFVTWQNLLRAAGWLAVIGLLLFPATRSGSKWRIAGFTAAGLAPVVAVVAWLGLHYYPDDARFAPPAQQAVITADRASVRTDAARNAPLVIEAPAGSLCRILDRAGDWTYIAFATDTRGWVANEDLAPLIVDEKPAPPKATTGGNSDERNA